MGSFVDRERDDNISPKARSRFDKLPGDRRH